MKALAVILLALVGTLIINGPIQSYADSRLDSLLRIATQAREHLQMNISQMNNVSDEIENLFKQGSDETDALANAIDQNDAASARQHFLSAMNFFKTTNQKINSLSTTPANNQQTQDVSQLQDQITRMKNQEQTLKTIAITNHVNFDFTQFDQLIQKAKQDLDNGNIDEVSKSIEQANQIIINAHHSLAEVAKQRSSDRAKDFTEKQIQRLNKTGDLNISQNPIAQAPIAPMSKTNSNLTSEENPREMITKVRKLISEGNIDEALKVIKSLEAYQKEKLKTSESSVQIQPQTSTNIQNNKVSVNSTTINPSSPITVANSTKIISPSNITVANPVKTNSSHSTNPSDIKVEINKTESKIIPQGNLDSEQQGNVKKNENPVKKDFEKQKSKKINHRNNPQSENNHD